MEIDLDRFEVQSCKDLIFGRTTVKLTQIYSMRFKEMHFVRDLIN